MALVDTNWNRMEYPAYSHPNMYPKMQRITQLPANTYSHMDLPVLLETYRAMKSVPPVEAFPLKAMAMDSPYRKPPKTTSSSTSLNKG